MAEILQKWEELSALLDEVTKSSFLPDTSTGTEKLDEFLIRWRYNALYL